MQDARATGGRLLMAGLDGSASNLANLGLLSKLGLVACDADDLTVSPDLAGLLRFDRVGTSQLDPWFNKTNFQGLCDANNLLLCTHGASPVCAPPKCLETADIEQLTQHSRVLQPC